jgi:hypothetical protein
MDVPPSSSMGIPRICRADKSRRTKSVPSMWQVSADPCDTPAVGIEGFVSAEQDVDVPNHGNGLACGA